MAIANGIFWRVGVFFRIDVRMYACPCNHKSSVVMKRSHSEITPPGTPPGTPELYSADTHTLDAMLSLLVTDAGLAAIAAEVKTDGERLTKKGTKSVTCGSSKTVYAACMCLNKKLNLMCKPPATAVSFLLKLFTTRVLFKESTWIPCFNKLNRLLVVLRPNINRRNVDMTGFRAGFRAIQDPTWDLRMPYLRGVESQTDANLLAKKKCAEAGLLFEIGAENELKLTEMRTKQIRRDQLDVHILDLEKLLALVNETGESETLFGNVAMVQLATGARRVEVFHVSDFMVQEEADKDKAPTRIAVSKVAKKGTANENQSFDKPTLFLTPSQVTNMTADIRRQMLQKLNATHEREEKSMSAFTNIEINTAFAKPYDYWLNKHSVETSVDGTNRPLRSHNLRRIYANLSYILYAPTGSNKAPWIQDVLGHTHIYTTMHYDALKIPSDKPELMAKIKTYKY